MDTTTLIIVACVIAFVVVPSFKNRTMPVKRLLVGPAIFLYLFYQAAHDNFILTPFSYRVMALGAFWGIVFGFALRNKVKITVDREAQTLTLPGDFFILWTFLAIFAVHFFIGYTKATSPAFFTQISVKNQLVLLLLALTSCLTVGANGCFLFRYYRQTQQRNLPDGRRGL